VTGPPGAGVHRVVVEADGGARGNPGPAGYGAVVRDDKTDEVLAERSGSLGLTTNNVAEYRGLIAGLDAAAELGAREVIVRMDSKLVVEQMTGRWQIRHPGLRPLAAQVATLMRRFDEVRFEWVPRERNRHADALANRAMDESAVPSERASGGPGSWAPRLATPTRMILVRHGETAHTEERRYSGRGDIPLSAHGVAQVEALAARLVTLAGPDTAVVSSPLSRCTDTAAAIASAVGSSSPVRIEPDLIECDFGAWDGRTFAEVAERWPAELSRWLASPAVPPPAGESFRAVTSRVRQVTVALRAAYADRTVIVVSHVSPIKIMLRDALAAGDAFLHRLHLDAAGYSVVDSWADGGVSVRTVNDTSHLGSA
jgi:broad specificity phosphatase PhoE/ribonuclease HI